MLMQPPFKQLFKRLKIARFLVFKHHFEDSIEMVCSCVWGDSWGDSWGDIVVTFLGAQLPPIFDFLGAQLGKLR